MDALQEIALFESRDIIERRYKALHGRSPNVQRCREIAAHLVQGRQYWDGAASAGDLSRPLLLYYGALSFCRALIMFRTGIGEEALSKSHGLSIVNWGSNYQAKGISAIQDFRVAISRGTFSQLVSACQSGETTKVFTGPFPSHYEITRPLSPVTNGTQITLGQALSRVPELVDVYERVLQRQANAYSVLAFGYPDVSLTLEVFATKEGRKPWTEILEAVGAADGLEFGNEGPSYFGNGRLSARLEIPGPWTGLGWLLSQLALDVDGNSWVIANLSERRGLGQLEMLFLVAYCLGMLVRYHPTARLELSIQSSGDSILPILRQADLVVGEVLPKLVLAQLLLDNPERRAAIPAASEASGDTDATVLGPS
jgi:hypothetical protein